MAIPSEVTALKRRFSRARRDYAKLKQSCEAQAVSWRWATWTMFPDTPYEFERSRTTSGRWLADANKRKDGAHCYGFDDRGRVVVERQLVTVPGWPERFYEELYRHGDGVIEGTRYDYDDGKKPINVSRVTLEGERIVARATWATGGCGLTKVSWRDDLPASISDWNQQHGRDAWTRRFELIHDRAGRLERIELHHRGASSVVYRRAKKGESVPELVAVVVERLVATIPAAVARARLREPVYALLLAYDWENPAQCLPPLLAVGLESERRAFVAAHGRESDSYTWNPAELANFDTRALALSDKRLLAAADLLGQELARRGSFGVVEKVLLEVARALNRRRWSELAPTQDFIVVPVDFETARIKRHLKALRRG